MKNELNPGTPDGATLDLPATRQALWAGLDANHEERQQAFDQQRAEEERRRRYREMEQSIRHAMQPPKDNADLHRLDFFWNQQARKAKNVFSTEEASSSVETAQAETQDAIRNLVANVARVLSEYATATETTHEKLLLVVRTGDGFLSRAAQLDAAMRSALSQEKQSDAQR